MYYELEEDCPPNNVNTTKQSLVSVVKREPVFSITNLDPRREYCVGIAAKTGAGIGKFSFEAVSCELVSLQKYVSLFDMHMSCMCVRVLQGIVAVYSL